MLTIASHAAVVVGTSPQHARWLGRDLEGVIGHSCREWSHPDYWDTNVRLMHESIAHNATLKWRRVIVRPDGTQRFGEITVTPLAVPRGKSVLVCTTREVGSMDIERPSERVGDAVDYIASLSRELADLSSGMGFGAVTKTLDAVTAQAMFMQSVMSQNIVKVP